MRRFLQRTICFLLIASIGLLSCESWYYYFGYYQKKVNGKEIYLAIEQSLRKQKKKKLLLGDSVGMQLFPCWANHGEVVSLTCNQAVSLAGHYLLLQNYLKTNADNLPEEVILLIHPASFDNNLDRFGFQYFLKPFYRDEYLDEYTDYLYQRCHHIPYWWLARMPFVRSSSYTVKYTTDPKDYALVSPLSREYLQRMDSVLNEQGIAFRIRPVPVSEKRKAELEDRLARAIEAEELPRKTLLDIQEKTEYYPAKMFRDNLHFTQSALANFNKWILLK